MEQQNKTQEDLVRVNLKVPRYDQSNFFGRFRHFLQITDMRTLFVTQSQLDAALQRLKDYEAKGNPPVTKAEAEELYKAKKIKDAIIHPDTGEKVWLPLRLSCFVPLNVVICAGLLAPNPSIGTVLFWQWINQSYNIGLNYANSNKSNALSTATIARSESYISAVGISCSVAVGLGEFVKRSHRRNFSPVVRSTIKLVHSFDVDHLLNSHNSLCHTLQWQLLVLVSFKLVEVETNKLQVNVFLMRWNEIKEGIVVKDEKGNEVGRSQKAGFSALSQVAFSRCMTSLPCLVLPPAIMSVLERTKFLKANPRFVPFVNLGVLTGCLMGGLPAAVAIFPQYVEVSPKDLEPSFHNLPVDKLLYNRGL